MGENRTKGLREELDGSLGCGTLEEEARLKELERYQILDTDDESDYDELAQLAAQICGAPVALVSFVDSVRQWFKARVGLDVKETPREQSFCALAIQKHATMVVEDASRDDRFKANPLVTDSPHIRFYAGAPLITRDGYALGTLCVIDSQPRSLGTDQKSALETLAKSVTRLLEYRLAHKTLEAERQAQIRFNALLAHDLRTPFNGLLSLSRELEESARLADIEQIRQDATVLRSCSESALSLLENLLVWSQQRHGLSEPQMVEIQLAKLASDACMQQMAQALDKGVTVNQSLETLPPYTTDEQMVSTVLRNLVSNAIKFSPVGGTVEVTLSADPNGAPQFEVHDEGSGLSPEALELLNREEPVESTRGTAGEKGSGLGLALCRKLLGALGSRLEIDTEAGVGTTARFTLPPSKAASIG